VEVVENVVKHQVVAILVLSQVLDKLWPVPPDGLDGLEDVDLPVLDDLLDARVRGAVHAAP